MKPICCWKWKKLFLRSIQADQIQIQTNTDQIRILINIDLILISIDTKNKELTIYIIKNQIIIIITITNKSMTNKFNLISRKLPQINISKTMTITINFNLENYRFESNSQPLPTLLANFHYAIAQTEPLVQEIPDPQAQIQSLNSVSFDTNLNFQEQNIL